MPGARLEPEDRVRQLGAAERARQSARVDAGVALPAGEGIAGVRVPAGGSVLQRGRRGRGPRPCRVRPAGVGREVQVPQGDAGRRGITRRVPCVERPQRRLAGFRHERGVLLQEAELLHHAPPHDLVAAVETQGHALAVEDLLFDVALDQVIQLGRSRRPAELPLVAGGQAAHVRRADGDPVLLRSAVQQPAAQEDEQAEPQEVEERLTRECAGAAPQAGGRSPLGDGGTGECCRTGQRPRRRDGPRQIVTTTLPRARPVSM